MAKRKSAAKKASRKSTPAKRTGAKRAAAAKGRVSAKAAKKAAKKTARKATAKKAARKVAAKRVVARKAPAKAAKGMKAAAKKAAAPAPVAKKAAAPKKAAAKKTAKKAAPGTDRASIPSSLGNLDEQSSAARSGGRAQRQQLKSHTETSPAMTGGDVDANWEEAYASGDEAPGGDNPTPDQDRVDEIGHALGVEYEDNEELKGADKISERDKHRWELNPASSDDYRERS
jgi:membrane protein involved in colicin uptake